MKTRLHNELSYVFIVTEPPSTSGMQIALYLTNSGCALPKPVLKRAKHANTIQKQEKFKWHTTMSKRGEAGSWSKHPIPGARLRKRNLFAMIAAAFPEQR